MLAALLLGLGIASYHSASREGNCLPGELGNRIVVVTAWMSAGFFFLSAISSIVLLNDVEGVPNKVLMVHLRRTHWVHCGPTVCVLLGIVSVAVSYIVDIGERLGCAWLIFGCTVGFPVYVGSNVAIYLYLKKSRRKLKQLDAFFGDPDLDLMGESSLCHWSDLFGAYFVRDGSPHEE